MVKNALAGQKKHHMAKDKWEWVNTVSVIMHKKFQGSRDTVEL